MGNSESNQELLISSESEPTEKEIQEKLLYRKTWTAEEVAKTPCRISHPYKKLVYNMATSNGTRKFVGTVTASRYAAIPLPQNFPPKDFTPTLDQKEDVFNYDNKVEDDSTVEWYVNFADTHLFVAYGGSLFAQDEMQAAEHPILGHIKETIANEEDPKAKALTREEAKPTPILISGVERLCRVKTDANAEEGRPNGLYGNNFARYGEEAVRKAVELIDPPTITNFICMAALGGGHGEYTQQQIVDTLMTAYTSFLVAKLESNALLNEGKSDGEKKKAKVIIHTGNWGTGAFGGNKVLMAIIQLVAATLARVDKIVYHTFNKEGTEGYVEGEKEFKKLLEKEISTKELIQQLVAKGYRWGVSDGN